MRLYQIDNSILAVINSANPTTGEIDAEALNGLEIERQDKQRNCLMYIKDVEMGVNAIDTEIARLREVKRVAESKATWLKAYLKNSMEVLGEKEVDFGAYALKIKSNPVALLITNEALIPDKYKKTVITTSIDKVAIKEAIKAGEAIEGCELVQGSRLDIK